jgi:hypothetical protein
VLNTSLCGNHKEKLVNVVSNIIAVHGKDRMVYVSAVWVKCRSYSNPCTCLDKPWGFQKVKAPRFWENRFMKVVKLSALRTGRLYATGNIPGTRFCLRLSRPKGHSAAGRNMSVKNSNDNIGNRTRNLPTCSAMSLPTARTSVTNHQPTMPNIPEQRSLQALLPGNCVL